MGLPFTKDDLDIAGILSLLNPMAEEDKKYKRPIRRCSICIMHFQDHIGWRCGQEKWREIHDESMCPFEFTSESAPGYGTRVGMKAPIFKKFGFPEKWISDAGSKAMLFMLIYSDWKMPEDPFMDKYGNYNKNNLPEGMTEADVPDGKLKDMKIIVHHNNLNKHDDSIWNLSWEISTEHTGIHAKLRSELNRLLNEQLKYESLIYHMNSIPQCING